jgi:FtsP/CotA-like multicopper oxidase with cupredoxin domain
VRVKQGQHVLFHFLNASATENIQLALPGHRFQVVALDGNPVPRPQAVEVLELGTAERIDAVVEMKNPGVWILGTPRDDDRRNGMGIVVEYANKTGAPRWVTPSKIPRDYTIFGENRPVPTPDEVIPVVFGKIKLGGAITHGWFAFGEYDLIAIVDMPGNVEAAAFSLAASAGGAVRAIKTTPLLSTAEGVEAMKKASMSGYKAPARA